MKQERNNKQANSNAHKQKEKYLWIRMYLNLNALELQNVLELQQRSKKSMFFMKIVTLSLVFQ